MDDSFFAPTPLRIRGGVVGAVRAAADALWSNAFVLLLCNLLWVMAALTLVLLPPATAALFFVARESLRHEVLDWRTVARPLRHAFVAAWQWGIVSLGLGAIGVYNLLAYGNVSGPEWALLRAVWVILLVVIALLSAFYWPFWYAQSPPYRTLRTTWRNVFLFCLATPLAPLTLLIVGGLAVAISTRLTIFIPTLLMVWLALLATALVGAGLPPTSADR